MELTGLRPEEEEERGKKKTGGQKNGSNDDDKCRKLRSRRLAIPSRRKGRRDFELRRRGSVRSERRGKTRRHFEKGERERGKKGELHHSSSAACPRKKKRTTQAEGGERPARAPASVRCCLSLAHSMHYLTHGNPLITAHTTHRQHTHAR